MENPQPNLTCRKKPFETWMLMKTIDYSCIHHVWRKYLNTTISRKLVHSTVKITVLSKESLKSWSETWYGYDKKARAVGETSWSTVETFCQKQDYSTLAFLASFVDTISLFYQQIYRCIIRFLSPKMVHTFDYLYCDIISVLECHGVLQNVSNQSENHKGFFANRTTLCRFLS